jgi:hypothetical protein
MNQIYAVEAEQCARSGYLVSSHFYVRKTLIDPIRKTHSDENLARHPDA